MHSKKFLAVTATVCLLLSCRKERSVFTSDTGEQEISVENDIRPRSPIENQTGEAKINAYNTFDSCEKADYWNERISEYILDHSLTQTQIAFLEDLLEQLNCSIFANSTSAAVFRAAYFDEWLEEAETILGMYHMVGILDLLSDPAEDVDASSKFDLGADDAPDCICRINSPWSCIKRKLVIGFPPSYTIESGSCENSLQHTGCSSTNSGCGFLGLWSCNGNHCNFTG